MTRSSNFGMFTANQRSELPTAGDQSQEREDKTAAKAVALIALIDLATNTAVFLNPLRI